MTDLGPLPVLSCQHGTRAEHVKACIDRTGAACVTCSTWQMMSVGHAGWPAAHGWDCLQVLDAAMDLINSLVATDSAALNALCLVGMLPAISRLSGPMQSRPLRRKAALFQYVCCHSSVLMLRMVVLCQVCTLPSFASSLCTQAALALPGALSRGAAWPARTFLGMPVRTLTVQVLAAPLA